MKATRGLEKWSDEECFKVTTTQSKHGGASRGCRRRAVGQRRTGCVRARETRVDKER